MLEYVQETGKTTLDGTFEGFGYSGFGDGKNNPSMEADADVGPCPKGRYALSLCADAEHPNLAMPVFRLTPVGHNAHGRTGLLIHGDSMAAPGTASHGCIIEGHAVRVVIETTKQQFIDVI